MNEDKPTPTDPSRAYELAIELERDAWHALRTHEPGSEARERAWNEWTRAIGRTNRAWRALSTRRLAAVGARPGASQPPQYARH